MTLLVLLRKHHHCFLGLWLFALSFREEAEVVALSHLEISGRATFLQTAFKAPIVSAASLSGIFVSDPSRRSAWAAVASESPTAKPKLVDLQSTLQRAIDQLKPVPSLLQQEKWDSVRAILLQAPVSDCWAKNANARALLQSYASALGDAGGEELVALELKEEVASHLRYLDMAVYNNVFNPIATEGTTGATKELVRSYYEDPINEYKASVAALQELVSMADEFQ